MPGGDCLPLISGGLSSGEYRPTCALTRGGSGDVAQIVGEARWRFLSPWLILLIQLMSSKTQRKRRRKAVKPRIDGHHGREIVERLVLDA